MPRELSYTDTALADFDAAMRWLTQPGTGPRAGRRLAAIWVAIERLRDHPCRYPVGQHRRVRELPCAGGYRALYRVYPDTGRDEHRRRRAGAARVRPRPVPRPSLIRYNLSRSTCLPGATAAARECASGQDPLPGEKGVADRASSG